MRGLIFPGQGSQAVGMGKDLWDTFHVTRLIVQEVDDILGYGLSRIMFEGPGDLLTQTQHTQPALFTTSMMVLKVLETEGVLDTPHPPITLTAGHSLGEYSALVAAGVLTFGDALRLLDLRGKAMAKAVKPGEGAMAALLGLAPHQLETLPPPPAGLVCTIANDNAPGQVVISGHAAAVNHLCQWAQAQGARAIPLNVAGPFHSPLMADAEIHVAHALDQVTFHTPTCPVIPNTTAQPTSDPEVLKASLKTQITGQVQWRNTLHAFDTLGVTTLLEIGTGAVLTGLARRTVPHIQAVALSHAGALRDFLTPPSHHTETTSYV